MKPHSALLAVLVLSAVFASPVAAQAPVPPLERPGPVDAQGHSRPDWAPKVPTAPASPDVALGQPGTVYRYQQTFGETSTPYLVDSQHLNRPNGIFIDHDNSLYVVEEAGHRMLKYNSSGTNTLTVGQAGQPWHHDRFLNVPKGVAVDAAGNIWVTISNAVKVFDATGTLLQMLPEHDPWNAGTDNSHFDEPRGIAFDTTGRVFVADSNNHRVQVYSVQGGALTYQATIGVTGVSGSDHAHFNRPAEIVIGPSGRLYVADTGNFRVQRCTYTTTWTCSTFHGTGAAGNGADQLNLAFGLGLDSTGNTMYIADSANGRVKKCLSTGSCSEFVGGLNWPADVAIDSNGTVFVSTFWDFTVRKYRSSGSFQGVFAGTSGVPYVTDGQHYNAPWGAAVAPDGSIYLAENNGFRLIKLDRNGAPRWTIGQPGVYGDDNAHFGGFWTGPNGNLAIDAAGRVYVPDTDNHRIQVFNADGSFHRSFGHYGTSNDEFDCPAGVAISPANGDIFVVDKCNQRIQVYTAAWVYRMTLGTLDAVGADNRHFSWPQGVAVDASGAVFVADTENYRVQKCTLSTNDYACTRLIGETGAIGDDYGHLYPRAVAVDAAGRVIVVDQWNDRVQVFDSSGAYLTTIGGSWGSRQGEMIDPRGVTVDQYGSLYVTEHGNHRLTKYAPGAPGWTQANINGFGDRNNHAAWSLGVFGNRLYVGATNTATGAEVYRLTSTGAWERVASGGLGDASNVSIDRLSEFNGQLYASTWVEDGSGAQIWRSPTGNAGTWSRVAQGGLGSTNNAEFMALTPFNGYLYAGTWVGDPSLHGAEIWRSNTGNNGSWSRVAGNGFDDSNNGAILAMKVFNGALYATTANYTTGGEVWRSDDGLQWTQVNANGFGSTDNSYGIALEVFAGKLYAGTWNSSTGAEIWRTASGTSWERVMQGGFGTTNNRSIAALVGFRGELLALVGNPATGAEVWRSTTGDTGSWRRVIDGGFGGGRAALAAWDNHVVVSDGNLYVGTYTLGNSGGRVWKYLTNKTYLPTLVAR